MPIQFIVVHSYLCLQVHTMSRKRTRAWRYSYTYSWHFTPPSLFPQNSSRSDEEKYLRPCRESSPGSSASNVITIRTAMLHFHTFQPRIRTMVTNKRDQTKQQWGNHLERTQQLTIFVCKIGHVGFKSSRRCLCFSEIHHDFQTPLPFFLPWVMSSTKSH